MSSWKYRSEHNGGFSLESSTFSVDSSNASSHSHLSASDNSSVAPYYADRSHQANSEIARMKTAVSPISPLSPQHSSQLSDTSLQLRCKPNYYLDNSSELLLQRRSSSCLKDSSLHYQGSPSSPSNEIPSSPSSPSSYQNVKDNEQCRVLEVPVDDKAIKHILEELEFTLMGPDSDDMDCFIVSSTGGQTLNQSSHQTLPATGREEEAGPSRSEQIDLRNLSISGSYGSGGGGISVNPYNSLAASISRTELGSYYLNQSDVERLLLLCAAAIDEDKISLAKETMAELEKAVSINGDPKQRLAAYMFEGLVARLVSSGHRIYSTLKCREAPAVEVMSAMQKMYEICPYFKFGHVAANGAIAEAFRDEDRVHIVDFQIVYGTQWISLLQALANRPGGPPMVRITVIDDPDTSFADGVGGLCEVGRRLAKLAASFHVPFEFCPVPVRMSEVTEQHIELRQGEALAVNFAMQLHHMPDESVSLTNPRDRLLRLAKGMCPKVLTLVEQEAHTNTAPFLQRFLEALDYYTAVFESIDVALPRDSPDRVNVEQQCLARDIVNVIACEGVERVERHELTGKWRARLTMAGFRPRPLSSYVNNTIRTLLGFYSEKYTLKEEGGALFLGWLRRPLVVASAWH